MNYFYCISDLMLATQFRDTTKNHFNFFFFFFFFFFLKILAIYLSVDK